MYSDSDEGEYYDSEYDDGPQAPDKLDKHGKNLPARLNISWNYTPTWGFDEGIRELFQNWRDGMLEIPGRNISITEISIEFHDRKPRSGAQFEFLAYDNSNLRQLLGKISFQSKTSSTGVEKSTLEIINRCITLDKEHLSMGDSSKKFRREFAGGHGEGMKVGEQTTALFCLKLRMKHTVGGINALLRAGFTVDFFTNHHKWHWNHFQGRELRVNFSKPKGKKDAARVSSGDLHVIVKGLAMNHTFFDRFLFLRIPTDEERIRPVDSAQAAQLGSVLVANKYLHKLFVAGIFVQDHEGDNGLHYGYDIPKFRLTRDREATNAHKLGEVICNLWSSLLPHSPLARTRFLELFETSPSCLDISNARNHLSSEAAQVLLKQLKESNPGCWFCSTVGGDLETTELIIRNSLKLQPKRLSPSLWWIFHNRFHLIKTAEQERIDRLKAAPPTRRISCPSEFASDNIHYLRMCLALVEETRHIQVSFVSADGDSDLEYVFENLKGSWKCLVNDSQLRPTALDHPACTRFHSLSEDDEGVIVPDDYTCFCSAIKLANLICEEALAKWPPGSRHRLNFFRQNLVQWIVAGISAETIWSETTDDIQSIKLSWSTALPINSVQFVVIIDEMPSEMLKVQEEKDVKRVKLEVDGNVADEPNLSEAYDHKPAKSDLSDIKIENLVESVSQAKPIDYHSVSINGVKRSTEVDSVREVARIKTLEPSAYFVNFEPGHKYRVQVQADKDLRLQDEIFMAPPSRPFIVYGPLRPPQELSVRWENMNQLSVIWKHSEGATSYELIFVGENDEMTEPIRVVDAQLGWTGLPGIHRPKQVKVRSLGMQGLVSERFAEADISHRLSPPEGIVVEWESSSHLRVNWVPVVHAETYELRFHQDEATYSLEVSEARWTGLPRSLAPVTVSIRSIASSDVRSEYSLEVAAPERPRPRLSPNVDHFVHERNVNLAENGVFRIANGLDADTGRNEHVPYYLGDRPLSTDTTSNGEVEDVLNHLAPSERAPSSRDVSPSAQNSPEPAALNRMFGYDIFDDRGLPPMSRLDEPQSDSSDEDSADEDSVFKRVATDDEFDVDNSLEASEVTHPLTGGREKRSTFNRFDYDMLDSCTISGVRLSVGDLFDFKRRRSGSSTSFHTASTKEMTFLGKVMEIHKLKSSGQVSLHILHWVYFSQWFNTPSGDWAEDAEDAVILMFDDEETMGSPEDAQVLEDADVSWCNRARHQKLAYKNAFDSSASPIGSFVCRVSASVSSAFTVLPLASHLSGKTLRTSSELHYAASTRSLDVADFFCGAGGLSLGFKQAGFNIKYGVDSDVEMLSTFSRNHSDATQYAQPVDDFIQDCKSNDLLPSSNPSFVLVSPSWQDLKSDSRGADLEVDGPEAKSNKPIVVEILKGLSPPYLVCVFGPREIKSQFNRILLELLQHGYSFSYKHIDSRQYGSANNRKYLILLAARGDCQLPEWPEPSITVRENYLTVRQVISDLNFENKRAGRNGVTSDRLGGTFCKDAPELRDAVRKLRDAPAAISDGPAAEGDYWVTNHVTGRRRRTRWGVVDPDAPLPVVHSTPSANWACKHWGRGDLLTVRELARIMSFPDSYKFLGSLESQYRQVANATPPSLARAIAEKIMQRLKEQRTRAMKTENGLAPKMEALDDKALLMDVDVRRGPIGSQSDRKRRFENDRMMATPHASTDNGATHERVVRPRFG